MQRQKAIVLTNGFLHTPFAKTCHGLLRGSDRFEVLAVIDNQHTGADAGEVMDGKPLGIPVYGDVATAMAHFGAAVTTCVMGVATSGGYLPDSIKVAIESAIRHKLSVVSGLHTFLSDDPHFSSLAAEYGVSITDVRKPRPRNQLKFWSGEIYQVPTPKIAVLGMDCAVGKRTTCRFVMEMCRKNGIATEMIYTGQTGWMQGYPHGFIFDSTVNDFIGGEVERAIVECARESNPELILIEGQSALRNPSGPCGAEFLLSGNAKGVILQHVPGRKHYEDTPAILPTVASEIALIQSYGAAVLAITLNEEGMSDAEMTACQSALQEELGLPVVRPLKEGVEKLLPTIRSFMERGHH